MKCPYCNQEHPDRYQFCPSTGQTINALKACNNPNCSEFGKHTISQDSLFCPICGVKLDDSVVASKKCGSESLFPVLGITICKTNIYDAAKMLGENVEKLDYVNMLCVRCSNSISLFQFIEDNSISAIILSIDYHAKDINSLPQKWQDALGFNFGASPQEIEREINKRGFNIIKKRQYRDSCHKWIFKDTTCGYIISVGSSNNHDHLFGEFFDTIHINTCKCLKCGSSDFEITPMSASGCECIYTCCNCGREMYI